jgi:hypothetical protein
MECRTWGGVFQRNWRWLMHSSQIRTRAVKAGVCEFQSRNAIRKELRIAELDWSGAGLSNEADSSFRTAGSTTSYNSTEQVDAVRLAVHRVSGPIMYASGYVRYADHATECLMIDIALCWQSKAVELNLWYRTSLIQWLHLTMRDTMAGNTARKCSVAIPLEESVFRVFGIGRSLFYRREWRIINHVYIHPRRNAVVSTATC